jgi:hypothetical protein
MRGAIPPLPQYAFMAWCPVEARGQLYLYLMNNYFAKMLEFQRSYIIMFYFTRSEKTGTCYMYDVSISQSSVEL